MPDADAMIDYMILAMLFFGGIAAILFLRHIAHKEMRERDPHPPAE